MTIDTWAYGPTEADTVSQALADNRVVEITRNDDGTFRIVEMNDEWGGATLTAAQFQMWIQELQALAADSESIFMNIITPPTSDLTPPPAVQALIDLATEESEFGITFVAGYARLLHKDTKAVIREEPWEHAFQFGRNILNNSLHHVTTGPARS